MRWGRLTGELPDPMPAIDSLLAATALVHGLKIATRNVEDFAASGVPILNPWKCYDWEPTDALPVHRPLLDRSRPPLRRAIPSHGSIRTSVFR